MGDLNQDSRLVGGACRGQGGERVRGGAAPGGPLGTIVIQGGGEGGARRTRGVRLWRGKWRAWGEGGGDQCPTWGSYHRPLIQASRFVHKELQSV